MTAKPLFTQIAVHIDLLDSKPNYDNVADVVARAVIWSLPRTSIVLKDGEPEVRVRYNKTSNKTMIYLSIEGQASNVRTSIAGTITRALEDPKCDVKVKVRRINIT